MTAPPPAPPPSPDAPPRPAAASAVPSIAELRRICQDPVRQYNDISGLVYGWPLSIYLTRAFLRLRLHADHASRAMFVAGALGSLLLLAPGPWRVAGLLLLMLAFVLDCVDGEMARYSRIDSYRWTAFDHLHHLTAKSLAFTCLGVGLFLEHGTPWTLLSGGIVSLAWLAMLVIRDLPSAIFARKIVLNENRERNPAYRRLVENLSRPDLERQSARPAGADAFCGNFRLRPWVVRAFLTNFDLVVPLFAVVAALGIAFPRVPLPGALPSQPPVALLLHAYALLLPLHALDVLYTAMWRGRFRSELYEMASRIERFRERP